MKEDDYEYILIPGERGYGMSMYHLKMDEDKFRIINKKRRTIKKMKRVVVDMITPSFPLRVHIIWDFEEEAPELPDLPFLREHMDQLFPGRFLFFEQIKDHQYVLGMEEAI